MKQYIELYQKIKMKEYKGELSLAEKKFINVFQQANKININTDSNLHNLYQYVAKDLNY